MNDSGGRRLQVSRQEGTSPVWSPDGEEIFYRDETGAMTAAIFDESSFSIVERRLLFEGPYLTANGRNYDISPDGRFLMVKPSGPEDVLSSRDDLHVVTDWFEELKRLVPIN